MVCVVKTISYQHLVVFVLYLASVFVAMKTIALGTEILPVLLHVSALATSKTACTCASVSVAMKSAWENRDDMPTLLVATGEWSGTICCTSTSITKMCNCTVFMALVWSGPQYPQRNELDPSQAKYEAACAPSDCDSRSCLLERSRHTVEKLVDHKKPYSLQPVWRKKMCECQVHCPQHQYIYQQSMCWSLDSKDTRPSECLVVLHRPPV